MEVRADHLPQRPALEVGSLELRIQPERRTRLGEAHAELDVLDARLRVAIRVESSRTTERVEPYGSEAGPEGRGSAGRALVDEVVEEVPKAGDDIRRLR